MIESYLSAFFSDDRRVLDAYAITTFLLLPSCESTATKPFRLASTSAMNDLEKSGYPSTGADVSLNFKSLNARSKSSFHNEINCLVFKLVWVFYGLDGRACNWAAIFENPLQIGDSFLPCQEKSEVIVLFLGFSQTNTVFVFVDSVESPCSETIWLR